MIKINHLSKHFGTSTEEIKALDQLSLSIEKGQFTKILGESGSGKSTLLNILAGLMKPSEGSVIIDGIDIYQDLDSEGLARFRREYLGFIFQSFNLLPYLNALENVLLPLAPLSKPKEEKMTMGMEALEKVGLRDRSLHLPNQLSGGQQQRVAIARALVNDPLILLADEPTGNLDHKTKLEILQLISELNQAGKTVLMVTHELSEIPGTTKTIGLQDGKLIN